MDSNFPPLQKAIKLSTNLICNRSAKEIRSHLNELISSINTQFSASISIPRRRSSSSARISKYSNTTNIQTTLPIRTPSSTSSRTPSRTPTTPRSPITPTTPTTLSYKSVYAISNSNPVNNTLDKSNNQIHYWSTLYVITKVCLMDLEYWEKGSGHPENRTSDSFYSQPKVLGIFQQVKPMNQRKIIEEILTDLGKIQEVVLGKIEKLSKAK